jgi:carbon storage regulator
MLVLTRKYQEKIRIGDNITITVLRTKGKAVRLGIDAPADVPVIRGELAFERSSDPSCGPQPAEDCGETKEVAAKKLTSERRPVAAPTWTAESPLHAVEFSDAQPTGQVELKRVPRAKVAELLPKLVSGAAPLRAMMDQR